MTTPPAPVGVAGTTALLERAIGYARGSLGLVAPDQLARPTPCTDWDLLALLAHLADSVEALHEAVTRGRVRLRGGGGSNPLGVPDPVSRLRTSACALLGEWARLEQDRVVAVGGARLSLGTVATAGALEICVHGWDVQVACGGLAPVPDPLAADLLARGAALVAASGGERWFRPPVVVPRSAAPGVRLLALTGRDAARWPAVGG